MDEIIKVIAGSSPYAALFFLLGKQALEIIHDYIRVFDWKLDRLIERMRAVEMSLNIDPPNEEDTSPVPVVRKPLS